MKAQASLKFANSLTEVLPERLCEMHGMPAGPSCQFLIAPEHRGLLLQQLANLKQP
jgi:hypothetical protein